MNFTVLNRIDLTTYPTAVVGDVGYVTSESKYYQWISGDQANLANWILFNNSASKKYSGGSPLAVGFDMQSSRPLDERDIVEAKTDLAVLPNAYPGITVKVVAEENKMYTWTGVNQGDLDQWKEVSNLQQFSVVITGADTVVNIKAIPSPTTGEVWITLDSGIDSYGNTLEQHDGMLYDGTGWVGIGPLEGPTGETGLNGTNGTNGLGWTSGVYNPTTGIVTFSSTDGLAFITDDLRGEDGAGIVIEGSDTVANILLKDATTSGILWIATDTGVDSYSNPVAIGDGLVSDGAGWSNVGPIRGPQGDKGDKGDTGDAGVQGVQGAQGDQGIQGIDGIQGVQGDQGIQGLTGNDGADGTNGIDGDDGAAGLPGDDGIDGVGVPVGGLLGQILSKVDGTDYNTEWRNETGGAGAYLPLAAGVGSPLTGDLYGVGGIFTGNISTAGLILTGGQPLTWNTDFHTVNIPTGTGSTLQAGQELYFLVHNSTGVPIVNGQVLKPTGVTVVGTEVMPTVSLARADRHETCEGTLFFATSDIAVGAVGMATRFGRVSDIDTSAFSGGNDIYLSPFVDGGITPTRPVFPHYTIILGGVLKIDAVAGVIANSVTRSVEDTVLDAWDGSFRESIDFKVDSNGTVITGSLEQSGGGDVTMIFRDGFTTLDCTPPKTIVLTAGTDSIPQPNYVYIPYSTKVLTVSTVDFPTDEHIKVADLFLKSATATQTDDALVNRNWNDHIKDPDNNGHFSHMAERLRQYPASWHSGTEGISTVITNDVWVSVTAGKVYQLHKQTFPALDTQTGDYVYVVNHATTPYLKLSNLNTLIVDANGDSLNNTSFSFVLWGIQNKTGETSHLGLNLPSGSYNFITPESAVTDALNNSVYDIPSNFNGKGFLIARFTYTYKNGVWVLYSTQKLTGKFPNLVAGGGGAGGAGGVSTFLGLTDTPSAYTGQAFKSVAVNSGETGVEFVTAMNGVIANNQVAFGSATNQIEGSNDFTWDGSILAITGKASGNDGVAANEFVTKSQLDGKEASLGNPIVDGYVLSSLINGTRSWVVPETGPQGADGDDGLDGTNGTDGTGWTAGSYNGTTGIVTFLSDDALGFVTGDLRGAQGIQGVKGDDGDQGIQGIQGVEGDQGIQGIQGDAGSNGLGWTGGSYDGGTGIVTFTSTDALGFVTGDLRGTDGADGSDGADGTNGTNGEGVPVGGTVGQVLEKIDGTNYNTQWATPSGGVDNTAVHRDTTGTTSEALEIWTGTQAEYDALGTYDSSIIYMMS